MSSDPKKWSATKDGRLQPPVADDGFEYLPITQSQARVMLSLCKKAEQDQILDILVTLEASRVSND